jgi:hypothetical protein
MTQADIGNLTHEQVADGYLTRRRVKTGENSPMVSYRFWNATLTLLERFKSKDAKYWFVNAKGQKLYSASYVDGVAVSYDFIKTAWKKSGCPINFGKFRSIGANLLESNEQYSRFVEHWLAHSPSSIKDRHYTTPRGI